MHRRILAAAALCLGLGGCYYGPYGTAADPVLGGAAIGAAAGALGGAVVGEPGAGAAAGAAAGALLGGVDAATRRPYGYYGYGPAYGYSAPPAYGYAPGYYAPYSYGPAVGFSFGYVYHDYPDYRYKRDRYRYRPYTRGHRGKPYRYKRSPGHYRGDGKGYRPVYRDHPGTQRAGRDRSRRLGHDKSYRARSYKPSRDRRHAGVQRSRARNYGYREFGQRK